MSKGIDLSDLKLSAEDQEALNKMAENYAPDDDAIPVATAYLVLVDEDGDVRVSPDIDIKIKRDRLPVMNDIFTSSKVIASDIEAQKTAQMTAVFMQQAAMAARQQFESQQLAQSLNLKH